MQSENTADLSAALAKAQSQMKAATFNKTNPHFKNRYADLAAVLDAIRKPLADNGLSYIQAVTTTERGMAIGTRLLHASGQWLQTLTPMKVENEGNQAIGSAITYGRRYALSAMLGIVSDDDDDSNAADGNHIEESQYRGQGTQEALTPVPERKLTKPQARPEYDKLLKEIKACSDVNGLATWGVRNKPRLDAMPEDWQMSLRNEYADHKATLKGVHQ